ncbi:hypothetical protein M422DRAFT_275600 [Sphaerobolus stellatus SS14]|uniref:Uncharacterized protein n=1 Tax=Sphaerobolus stellatus (strain SS14) TaxID=990650 RepID=A0A0C9UEV9_SPHS4|nr:hypothetical protein M422DRAFT_275600 [Sphaerobolus stellatus SS14]
MTSLPKYVGTPLNFFELLRTSPNTDKLGQTYKPVIILGSYGRRCPSANDAAQALCYLLIIIAPNFIQNIIKASRLSSYGLLRFPKEERLTDFTYKYTQPSKHERELKPEKKKHHSHHSSFSDEMLADMRQQHELDMSEAQSKIRELEPRASTSAHPSPPISEDRKQSLSSNAHRPLTPSSLREMLTSRPVYEDNLPPETRHKRKISLSMLKARVESGRGALSQHAHE